MPKSHDFPEPPSTATRHRLLAEWDIHGFKTTIRLKPSHVGLIGIIGWELFAMAAMMGGVIGDNGAIIAATCVVMIIPFLIPQLYPYLTGRMTEISASPTGLRFGERDLPWDSIVAVDVPVGVLALRITTKTEEILLKLATDHQKTGPNFEELEWAAASIRHIKERSESSGTEVDIPEELRATAHRAASSSTQSQ